MGFCTAPRLKVHRWPQKFGKSDYLPTPCLVCMPTVRRKMFQETLSFRMFSTVIQEASTAATIFYHYFHQTLTLTQFCLTICIPWPTYSELPFLIIFHCSFSLLIITCFSCMPMHYGSCNMNFECYCSCPVCVCMCVCS